MDLNETDYFYYTETSSLSRSIRFWLLILIDIPSIICSLVLFYYLLRKKTLRTALNNHVIIIFLFTSLFTQLIDVPFYLNFLYLGFVWPQTLFLCIIWWYAGTTMYNTTSILVAWLSFERHILIFHDKLISTRKKQWIFHYIPMIFLLLYPILFHILVLIIPSCNETFSYNYNQDWCNFSPCYYNNKFLSLYDLIIHSILPCLLIVLFSLILFIRIIWKRNIRLNRIIQWKKYHQMIKQLLSISLLFILFNLPLMIYYFLYILQYLSDDINPQIELYLTYLTYFSVLLLPFVILFSLSINFWKKLLDFIRRQRLKIYPAIIEI